MKTKIKVLIIFLTVIITSVIITKPVSAQQPYVSFQVFYDQLNHYGQWIESPIYGYIWIPDAGPDFVPYLSRGHWILTNYGWTWFSDYDWGWAAFHYGRWDFNNYYGWFWIPDNEWGPAWVSWRRGDGYYGWEPMGPGVSIGVSIGRQYDNHNDHWIFVRERDLDRSDVNRLYVGRMDHDRILRSSTVINNTYVDNRRNTTYVTGPAIEDVQKATGRRFNPVSIQENDRPGQDLNNGQLRIYRPLVTKNNNIEHPPGLSKIIRVKDAKQPSQRDATNQPSNNRSEKQTEVVTPHNNTGNVRSDQHQVSNPDIGNRREQQPENVNQRNSNNNTQPVQPQNANPSQNISKKQQQNNVQTQNAHPDHNIGKEHQQNPSKPSVNRNNEQQKKSETGSEKKK